MACAWLNNGASDVGCNLALEAAVEVDNLEMVELLAESATDHVDAIYIAAALSRPKLIACVADHVADAARIFDAAMWRAAVYGNVTAMRNLIAVSTERVFPIQQHELNNYLRMAAEHNEEKMARFLVAEGATDIFKVMATHPPSKAAQVAHKVPDAVWFWAGAVIFVGVCIGFGHLGAAIGLRF